VPQPPAYALTKAAPVGVCRDFARVGPNARRKLRSRKKMPKTWPAMISNESWFIVAILFYIRLTAGT